MKNRIFNCLALAFFFEDLHREEVLNVKPPFIDNKDEITMSAVRKRWFIHFFDKLPDRIQKEKKPANQVHLIKELIWSYQESKALPFFMRESTKLPDSEEIFTYGENLKSFESTHFGVIEQTELFGSAGNAANQWEGFHQDDEKYPLELDIALQAWRAVAQNNQGGEGTPKQRLENWISKSGYDLKTEQIKRIAIICNWDKSRGRK